VTNKLSAHSREILMQPRFSIKAPNAFSLEGDRWIDCVSILSINARGKVEVAYPSYNTRPTWPGDGEGKRALDELHRLLEAVAIDLYIAPGDWVVWDNSALVHRRGPIGQGRRKLWRNYIRSDCDAMRAATGTPGPIFSARALLETDVAALEEWSHVG
jgi:hypothetical protein